MRASSAQIRERVGHTERRLQLERRCQRLRLIRDEPASRAAHVLCACSRAAKANS